MSTQLGNIVLHKKLHFWMWREIRDKMRTHFGYRQSEIILRFMLTLFQNEKFWDVGRQISF